MIARYIDKTFQPRGIKLQYMETRVTKSTLKIFFTINSSEMTVLISVKTLYMFVFLWELDLQKCFQIEKPQV